MSVLSDADILKAIERGHLSIHGFQESCLTPNGYDLRISEILVAGEKVALRSGSAIIPPMRQAFVSTVESLELPADICAQLWLRTTWIRRGVIAGLGKVDAGFSGTLTFSAFNLSANEVEMPVGERFVQIVFEDLRSSSAISYERRSGHYQGQKGITLEPLDRGDR